jgi:hypothetical protein
MARWMMILILGASLVAAGCKSQEEKVKVYDKPSDPMVQGPPTSQNKQPDNMKDAINSNPNLPDAAKKALGTK